MLASWLTSLEQVHEAKTPEAREAIYRFRYTVYVEELGRELGGADHDRKRVCDEDAGPLFGETTAFQKLHQRTDGSWLGCRCENSERTTDKQQTNP